MNDLTDAERDALNVMETVEGNWWDHLTFTDDKMILDTDDGRAVFELALAFREPTEDEWETDPERYDVPEQATVSRMLYRRNVHSGPYYFGRAIRAERQERFYEPDQGIEIINDSEWAEIEPDTFPSIDVWDGPNDLHYTFIFAPIAE